MIAKKISNDPDLDETQLDLIKHPKFFFFDIGVVNALRGSFDISGDRIEGLWEHIVYNQFINTAQSLDVEMNIYNFRTRGGFKVDFIIAIDSKKIAVEVKSASL